MRRNSLSGALAVIIVAFTSAPGVASGPNLYFYADRERIGAATECNMAIDNNGIRACSFLILVGGAALPAALYQHRAEAYLRKGEFDHAIVDLSRAIAINPNDPEFYAQRATAYREQKNDANASVDAAKALAMIDARIAAEQTAENYGIRANILHLAGRDADALPDVMTALEADPENSGLIEMHATLNEALGKRDEAIVAFREAMRLALAEDKATTGKMYTTELYLKHIRAAVTLRDAKAALERLQATP